MSLHLDSVSHRFGRQLALDGVSLHIEEGDCYGFLGHNGAGKTTAMRIILGLMRPTSGRVIVDGFEASRHPREARARMGGLIEVPGFHPSWDGARNLAALARLQGMTSQEARREALRKLELVGLHEVGPKPVRAYSQGMRQRLGIAQALLGRPRYVLLDEPTNGLDPEGIAEIRSLILRLRREEGTTFLISSHQLAELSGLTNKVGVIRQGRLLVEGKVLELLRSEGREYRLEAEPPDRVQRVLEDLGLHPEERPDGALVLDLGEHGPEEVLRALLSGDVRVRAFSPREPTLEEFYLSHTRGREGAEAESSPPPAPAAAEPPPGAPAERLAPPRPLLRVIGYDLGRWGSQVGTWLLLLAPALAGALRIYLRHLEVRGNVSEVEAGTLASTGTVTAFEGVGLGVRAGYPLLAFLALGLASQSLAAERGQGTLRNLLLRPLRRTHVAAGKGISVLLAVFTAYALLLLVSIGASALAFDFTGLTEVLPNGELWVYPDFTAGKLWGELQAFLPAPLLPLAALTGIGFFCGSLVRAAATGLAASLVLGALLDVAEQVLRPLHLESWLPSAYMNVLVEDPWDQVHYYLDSVTGVGNAAFHYADTAVRNPLIVALAAFTLGALVLVRKPVP